MEWVVLGVIALVIFWAIATYNGLVGCGSAPTRLSRISMCS